MAKKIFSSSRTDPRYLLRRAMRLMAKSLDQLAERAKVKEVLAQSGAVITPGGLQGKDIDSLVTLSNTLHRLAKQADADEKVVKQQLRGMSDEQLEEEEKRLKSQQHSEAIKEGLRARMLEADEE